MSERITCEQGGVPGCSLVLASAFLHVKISIKVVRVFLGNVTSFLEHVCAGGGGGVM